MFEVKNRITAPDGTVIPPGRITMAEAEAHGLLTAERPDGAPPGEQVSGATVDGVNLPPVAAPKSVKRAAKKAAPKSGD